MQKLRLHYIYTSQDGKITSYMYTSQDDKITSDALSRYQYMLVYT